MAVHSVRCWMHPQRSSRARSRGNDGGGLLRCGALAEVALLNSAPEAVACVDGGCGGHANLLCWHVELELKAAKQHHGGDHGLEHRKLVANALALAAAEGDECEVGGGLGGVETTAEARVVAGPALHLRISSGPLPAVGVEKVRIFPQLRRAAHVIHRDHHVARARDLDAALDAGAALGPGVGL
eukprot:scaffold181686_cov32-Tisochrysis_lutea.AAC.2